MDINKRLKPILDEYAREQYQRGWNDAIAHVMKAVQPVGQQALPLTMKRQIETEDEHNVITLVEHNVRQIPGQRGRDIVHTIATAFPGRDIKTMDRTVRTALARLLKRGKVMSQDGRWYPAETL